LSKKQKANRGETIWTFGFAEADVEILNDWMGEMCASRLGKALLVRIKGIPMGNSLSPVRASLCLSECERLAWTASKHSRAVGFSTPEVSVQQSISGRRIADDTTLISRELCEECVERFGLWCYQHQRFARGLSIEVEEKGREIKMCDREIKIVGEEREEKLIINRYEKNREYLIGCAAEPKRVRFQPALGHVSARRVLTWITARWYEEWQKNETVENVLFGQLEVLAEILDLGYTPRFVQKTLGMISKPEWRQSAEIGKKWCKWLGRSDPNVHSKTALRQLLIDWNISI
jgi:hypothetical protein